MIDGPEHVAGDAGQLAYEEQVALGVARLVAMARAFRVRGNREERLLDELQAAQTDLMLAILLTCGAGMTIEDVRSRLIEPALNRPGVTEEAIVLLREAMRSVQEHLG